MNLYSQQQEALNKIASFMQKKNCPVFILKGYAGTGKTTMIRAIIEYANSINKHTHVMAPTGRAAKVLREKTGIPATTIHKAIYAYKKIRTDRHDEQGKLIFVEDRPDHDSEDKRTYGADDIQMWFGLKVLEQDLTPSDMLYIVDESSLISSKKATNEFLHFGTDVLIDDLLTFVQPALGGKIIFVGDPAQLPPVGDNRSAALDESFFQEKDMAVESFELTEVVRQKGDSAILKNAMIVRDVLKLEPSCRNQLCYERKEDEVEDSTPMEVVSKFVGDQPQPEIGNSIVVCYSNAKVKEYNDEIRQLYFPGNRGIMVGDVLQVVKNSIFNNVYVFNGDFVTVTDVSDVIDVQSAPVWLDLNGKKERVNVELYYQDIKVITEYGQEFCCKIIKNLLDSSLPSLKQKEVTSAYINFRMRHPEIKSNREVMASALLDDPYFNALNAKYGYAITCHKSQGGEWKNVYVDYGGRTGTNDDCLRWQYTATTRAVERLYGVNIPSITPLSKMTFSKIIQTKNAPKCDISYAAVSADTPLSPAATNAQKAKYISAEAALGRQDMVIMSVQELQYKDRYIILTSCGQEMFDCYYNRSGVYTSVSPLQSTVNTDKIVDALKSFELAEYNITYVPETDGLKQLHAKIMSACDEYGIKITNIQDDLDHYKLTYHFITSGQFSNILFYINKEGFITRAMPSSDLGEKDDLLNKLIQTLQK